MSKIFDCFCYSGERIIDLRLSLLKNKVDYFIVGESEIDFKGNLKNRHFKISRYPDLKDKIIYLNFKKEEFSDCKNAWDIEAKSRNLLMKGLGAANDNDIILLSDCDEIFNPEKIQLSNNTFNLYEQINFRFYGNYLNIYHPLWTKAVSFPMHKLKKFSLWDIHCLHRDGYRKKKFTNETVNKIQYGGWHFSYLGGYEEIKKKFNQFHNAFIGRKNIPNINKKNLIEKKIQFGVDLLNFNHFWNVVENYHLGNKEIKYWFCKNKLILKKKSYNYNIDSLINSQKKRSYIMIRLLNIYLFIRKKIVGFYLDNLI
ncbi:hypothetical protein ACIJYE_00875 [Candidatus Pelagibacter bacterium nBUS_30]|uniref:hypothetical protein n=1 Tax=Candidatus Pelagibacter bacterium nBUS_30 TaxID=3374191 RepID=UPI003EBE5897